MKFFNVIYPTGKIPSDRLKSTFVTVCKKTNASHCDDCCMISLTSHVLKVFLPVIHTRIYRYRCELLIGRSQFGFGNGIGARKALFHCMCLPRDCVSHQKPIAILKSTGIYTQDLIIISELYWHQTATVRVEHKKRRASGMYPVAPPV